MIEVYTREGCGHCVRAKNLLTTNNIAYTEKVIGVDIDREAVIESFPESKSLPIIAFDGLVVGFEELQTMIQTKQI
jgi:glutaredoxin